MECFEDAPLAPSGMPILEHGEKRKVTVKDVTVASLKPGGRTFSNGAITITTSRVVWYSQPEKVGYSMPRRYLLKRRIGDGERHFDLDVGTGIRIQFIAERFEDGKRLLREELEAQGMVGQGSGSAAQENSAVNVFFQGQGSTQTPSPAPIGTYSPRGVPTRWQPNPASSPVPPTPVNEIPRVAVGLAAVRERINSEASKRDDTIQLFSSDRNITEFASQLVKVAEHIRGRKSRGEAENELLSIMAEVGVISEVTRGSVGHSTRKYRAQKAAELSQQLPQVVSRVGGVMTLSDVYLYVNQRSKELISPTDLLGVAELMSSPDYPCPLQLKELDSGVKAFVMNISDDRAMGNDLKNMATRNGSGLSVSDLMLKRSIPASSALGMLESAEEAGFLARDDTVSGTRFYPNRFVMR